MRADLLAIELVLIVALRYIPRNLTTLGLALIIATNIMLIKLQAIPVQLISFQNIETSIISSLDRCTGILPLPLCRLFFNKPIYIVTQLVSEQIQFFSDENQFRVLPILVRPFMVAYFYFGVISLFLIKKPAISVRYYQFWFLFISILGMVSVNKNTVLSLCLGLFAFISIRGCVMTIEYVKHYANNHNV